MRERNMGDLKPKQLQWCRDHIPNFAIMEQQSKDALEHAMKVKRELEGK